MQIAANQSANGNIETHVPLGLVSGWCLGAESLPSSYRQGKLVALRLLCSLTCRAPYVPTPPRPHLPLYHRALHHGIYFIHWVSRQTTQGLYTQGLFTHATTHAKNHSRSLCSWN